MRKSYGAIYWWTYLPRMRMLSISGYKYSRLVGYNMFWQYAYLWKICKHDVQIHIYIYLYICVHIKKLYTFSLYYSLMHICKIYPK